MIVFLMQTSPTIPRRRRELLSDTLCARSIPRRRRESLRVCSVYLGRSCDRSSETCFCCCRDSDSNVNFEGRAFFRRRVEQPDGSYTDGTFGGVAWGRFLTHFEGFNLLAPGGQQPFDSLAEKQAAEVDGTFVGYLPDLIEQLIGKARRGYAELYRQQVSSESRTAPNLAHPCLSRWTSSFGLIIFVRTLLR